MEIEIGQLIEIEITPNPITSSSRLLWRQTDRPPPPERFVEHISSNWDIEIFPHEHVYSIWKIKLYVTLL